MPRARPPFQLFFDQQAPAVHRFLRGMVGPDDAEECLQESFIAALRAYERFDGRSPRSWILAIARRKAVDHARARARRPEPRADVAELVPTPPGEAGGRGLWVRVAQLPPKQRAALLLRFALDLPHREIGEVVGCSEAAARRSVHEGLAKLRETTTKEAV